MTHGIELSWNRMKIKYWAPDKTNKYFQRPLAILKQFQSCEHNDIRCYHPCSWCGSSALLFFFPKTFDLKRKSYQGEDAQAIIAVDLPDLPHPALCWCLHFSSWNLVSQHFRPGLLCKEGKQWNCLSTLQVVLKSNCKSRLKLVISES